MMEKVDEKILSCVCLTEPQVRSLVSSFCGWEVSRSWLWRMRKELGVEELVFSPDGARVLAYYAKLRHRRIPASKAKEQTIKFAEENGL